MWNFLFHLDGLENVLDYKGLCFVFPTQEGAQLKHNV